VRVQDDESLEESELCPIVIILKDLKGTDAEYISCFSLLSINSVQLLQYRQLLPFEKFWFMRDIYMGLACMTQDPKGTVVLPFFCSSNWVSHRMCKGFSNGSKQLFRQLNPAEYFMV